MLAGVQNFRQIWFKSSVDNFKQMGLQTTDFIVRCLFPVHFLKHYVYLGKEGKDINKKEGKLWSPFTKANTIMYFVASWNSLMNTHSAVYALLTIHNLIILRAVKRTIASKLMFQKTLEWEWPINYLVRVDNKRSATITWLFMERKFMSCLLTHCKSASVSEQRTPGV